MNIIGLEEKKVKKLTDELNGLLANYQIFYQNLRGYHWNIKGENFFELHVKFEEYYNDAQVKIDEIAERILTLGKTPFHSYSDYLEENQLKTLLKVLRCWSKRKEKFLIWLVMPVMKVPMH